MAIEGEFTRLGMIAAAEEEIEQKSAPRQPLGFWRTVLAVLVGMLLFGVIAGAFYYWGVAVPAEQARAQQEYRSAMDDLAAASDNLAAQNARIEEEIKQNHPGDVCNALTGADFLACGQLKTRKEKQDFVKQRRH